MPRTMFLYGPEMPQTKLLHGPEMLYLVPCTNGKVFGTFAFKTIYFCLCMCLCVWACPMRAHPHGQKIALDPHKLELQKIVATWHGRWGPLEEPQINTLNHSVPHQCIPEHFRAKSGSNPNSLHTWSVPYPHDECPLAMRKGLKYDDMLQHGWPITCRGKEAARVSQCREMHTVNLYYL